jgi:SAM-dependent methyltransferase
MSAAQAVAKVLASRGIEMDRIEQLIERYERNVETLKPYLPVGALHFLDIGSGTGGIAALVAEQLPDAYVHLIDGAEQQEAWTSYRAEGKPWASVANAVSLVKLSLPNRRVFGYTPPVHDELDEMGFDLIYSLCSWGHHYSIDTYIDMVARAIRPDGTVITDLRISKTDASLEALAKMNKRFRFQCAISQGKKYIRYCWRGR